MTRILYWNIERFSRSRIDPAVALTPLLAQMTGDQRDLIASVLSMSGPGQAPQPLDIIVVVEVSAHTDPVVPEGRALEPDGPGGQGVRMLLNGLRNTLGAQWSLVPPLLLGSLGYREAVAVFYDSNKLLFTGPYVWSDPPGHEMKAWPAVQPTLAHLQGYDPIWASGLPAPGPGRAWNIGGVQVLETQSAGQWMFEAGGHRIYFPGWENRSPFYTRFVDLHGGPNGNPRVLKLFSVHTSPSSASPAVENLAAIQELQPGANEVSVIVGDFNVNTFDKNVNGAYRRLVEDVGQGGQGFTFLLDPRDPNDVVNPNRMPYCMTHMLPLRYATSWNASAGAGVNKNVYPRFGYMGSVTPNQQMSEAAAIDNAFVRYGYAPAPVSGASVVNPVVGTPYNKAPAPPGVTQNLTNGAPFPSLMATGIPQPGGVNPPFDPGDFLGWSNYGKVRSTSDHLPLYVEV